MGQEPLSVVLKTFVFEIFHPVAERLLTRCDAVLRIGGPSAGADMMVAQARAQGKTVYTGLDDVPRK